MDANIKPDFNLPTKIFIKNELNSDIASITGSLGKRAVFVSTSEDFKIFLPAIESIILSLKKNDINCLVYDDIPSSPNTEDIDNCVSFLKKTNCDLIIGFGGIESLNASKAASLLAANYVFCHDLLQGKEALLPPLKHITIPAYPVFGFELFPSFYLTEIHGGTKQVYYSEALFPEATLIDPSTARMCDIDISIRASICSLAIAAESVISRENNDLANTFALKSIDFIFRNLILCSRDPGNYTARSFVSSASVMSGIAFSSSMLSASLSIALAISSYSDIDVQSAMCIILPHIMEYNLTSSPGKYVQMSKVMGEDVKDITVIEAAIKTIEAIRKLQSDLDSPHRLSDYEVQKSLFREISILAVKYPFLKNAPREIKPNEVETILYAAY